MSNTEVDYNLSIIMPYYKKMKEFTFTLPLNYKYFCQKGVEIILVVDEPLKKTDFNFLENFPNLKYKIIVNNVPHEWRNPAKVINVGIRNANKKYILVMSPETIMTNNAIDIFHRNYKPNSFVTGYVTFVIMNEYNKVLGNNFKNYQYLNYGSFYINKNDLIKVGGYNENFICWGGEDDEIRFRLTKNKYNKLNATDVKLAHIDLEQRSIYKIQKHKGSDQTQYNKQKKYLKNIQNIKFDTNGFDFKEVLIDKTEAHINLILNITDRNEKITIDASYLLNHPLIVDYKFGKLVKKEYFIMNLFQIFNEENNLLRYFNSINRLADGIIILDDGSTDNSWIMLNDFDYTLKVRIKRELNIFNDLRNRNLLIEVLQNILLDNDIFVKWVYWQDADEVIANSDSELVEIKQRLRTTKFELLTIDLYHMWNDTHYNAEYPKSLHGKSKYFRIFKNIKNKRPFKISSDKNLHFRLIPYNTKLKGNLPIKIKHYGMSTSEKRKIKYFNYMNTYDKERKNQLSYSHIIKEKPKLKKFE